MPLWAGAFLEDINGKFDVIVEAVGQLNDQMKFLKDVPDDLKEVKEDVKTIKSVLTGHSQQLADHEERITTLETV